MRSAKLLKRGEIILALDTSEGRNPAVEARILALVCSQPPPGYSTWTLRLLADTCVELQYVDSLSHMTGSRLFKNAA
jgi:hypothetical protein